MHRNMVRIRKINKLRILNTTKVNEFFEHPVYNKAIACFILEIKSINLHKKPIKFTSRKKKMMR